MFKLKKLPGIAPDRLPFLYLAAAGILEFLLITAVCIPSYLGYYLAETYLIVPCLLFLGHILGTRRDPAGNRRLLLAAAAVAWFVITQTVHKLSGMETRSITTVFFVYLMAFPFAVLTEDRENTGIRRIGGLLLAASLVLVGFSLLLLLEQVPGEWKEFLFWDGTRLHVFWHPNISACFFMVGMGFATVFLLRAKKPLTRILLAVAVAVQFVAMALTNCRTTILMTGALFGGIVFFLIFRGGWKRFFLGLLAAVLVLVGFFKISGSIFQWNEDRIIAGIREDLIAAAAEAPQEGQEPAQEDYQFRVEADGQVVMESLNPQNSLASDMRTLNGRTYIWTAALAAVRDNQSLARWGTEYVGTVISVYNPFPVEHGHNSWIQAMLVTGLPGLVLALVFTAISVWSAARLLLNRAVELWKKVIAMMTMCVLVAGALEPYLFVAGMLHHSVDFIFFFCTGYLDHWCRSLPKKV